MEAPTPAEELLLGLSSAPFSVASKCKVNLTVFFTSDLPTRQTIGNGCVVYYMLLLDTFVAEILQSANNN